MCTHSSLSLFQDYQRPAALADFIAQVGVDPSTGISRDDAMARRALYGANRVTPPVNCPSWVCCLLPCLLRTASMQAYHAALPKEAVVRRKVAAPPSAKPHGAGTREAAATRRMRMDAMSLVYGDVVELTAGDLVGADMRVVECSSDCLVDQSTLAADDDDDDDDDANDYADGMESGEGSLIRKHVTTDTDPHASAEHQDPLKSRNILLMASRVVRGTAVGVVIATGDHTLWGHLLAHHQWPVASTSKRAGLRNKYPEEHRLMNEKKSKSREIIV